MKWVVLVVLILSLDASADLRNCVKMLTGVYKDDYHQLRFTGNTRIKNYQDFLLFLNGERLSSKTELIEYKKFVDGAFLPLLEQVLTYSGVVYRVESFFGIYQDRLLTAVQNREWFQSIKDSFVAIVIPKEGQVHPELNKAV